MSTIIGHIVPPHLLIDALKKERADGGAARFPQSAVRRALGLGCEALGYGCSSVEGLPIRLRTASRTLARPLACILCFTAAVMLMTSGAFLSRKPIQSIS
jgi:hypothetical protein